MLTSFQRNWFIVLIFTLFLVGTVLTIKWWSEPQKAQTVTSLVGLLATMILLTVTWLYVRATREQVALLREQWEEERTARLSFFPHVERNLFRELNYSANAIRMMSQVVHLEVWNLGRPTLNIQGVRFTQKLTGRTRAIEAHEIIKSRDVGQVDVTELLLDLLSHTDEYIEIVNSPAAMRQMEVRVLYSSGAGTKITAAHTFEFSPSVEHGRILIVLVEPPIVIEQ